MKLGTDMAPRRTGRWIAGAAVMTSALLSASSAHALTSGAVGLFNGSVLSVNGLNLTVANCIVRLGAAGTSVCPTGSSAAYEMLQFTGAGATVKIQGINGADIFSNIATGTNFYDLKFDLQVAAPSTRTTVNQVAMTMSSALTGSAGTPVTAVSAGESFSAGFAGATNFTLNGYGVTGGNSGTFTAVNPTGSTFSVTKDLKVNQVLIAGADTVSLRYVTQSFTPAPEPVSISVMLSGLAGLSFVRNRRRKAARRTG